MRYTETQSQRYTKEYGLGKTEADWNYVINWGSWPSTSNKSSLQVSQEIQARLYWGLLVQQGEVRTNNMFSNLLAPQRGGKLVFYMG